MGSWSRCGTLASSRSYRGNKGKRPAHSGLRDHKSGRPSQRAYNNTVERGLVKRIRQCCMSDLKSAHEDDCTRDTGKCRDKKGYVNRESAKFIAQQMMDTHRVAFSYYSCTSCFLWHVGRPANQWEARL